MPLNKVSRDLTSREQAVLDCIPAGHANAISRRRLARVACLDDR
jgi:DNA-binding NarL/FixJ family response regulator